MYYVAIRYIDPDGYRTSFSDITGPFAVSENGANINLDVTGLDTTFPEFELAVLAVVDNSISVTLQDRRAILGSSTGVTNLSGNNILENLEVEDLTVRPVTYRTAKTVALHNKRLYLGNVQTYDTEDLQDAVNQIQPLWTLVTAGTTTSDTDYPFDRYFMFNEVYAFYVAFVRADGSMSEAFHIPGRQIPSTFSIRQVVEAVGAIDSNLSMTDSLSTLNNLYLSGSEDIDGDAKVWHFECTASVSTDKTKGECGFWENENEVYPSTFSSGYEYTWDATFSTSTQSVITLANEKVRHHRMPSKSFLVAHNAPVNDAKGLKIDFTNVSIPNGYVGAKFFYANRDGYKGLVMTQDYAIYGQPNFYSGYGSGGTTYQNYRSSSITNRPYRNFRYISSSPNDSDGDAFDVASASWHSAWGSLVNTSTSFDNTVAKDFMALHSFDLLDDRPFLGSDLYVRVETGEGHRETGSSGDDGDSWYWGLTSNAMIDDDTALYSSVLDYYYTLTENTLGRNKRMNTALHSNPSLPSSYPLNPGTNADRYSMMPSLGASLKIDKIEYVPADVVSDSLEFDNRFGPECIGISLDVPQTLENAVFVMFDDTDSTVTRDSYRYGQFMDAAGGKIPMIAVLLMRHTYDVYNSYKNQDLVACTGVATGTTIVGAVGDVVYSEQVTRVTGASGWNAHHPNLPTDTADLSQPVSSATDGSATADISNPSEVKALTTSAGTADTSRGFIAARYKFERLTKVNFAHLDNEHTDLDEWDRLNHSTTPERSHLFKLDGYFKSQNVFLQPLIKGNEELDAYLFPNRIVRSEASQPEDTRERYKSFRPLDFYEQPKERGSITKLIAYADRLLIHHEQALYLTIGQEKLSSTAGEIVLGSGDIFRVPPKEVIPSEYGHAGLEFQLASTMTPAGYFFVDTFQRKVYLFNGKLNDLTRAGMRQYFQETLEFDGWTSSTGTSTGNGAVSSFYPGIHVEYDPQYNRVVMLVRNHKRRLSSTGQITASNIPDSHANYLADSAIKVLDETISFSFDNMAWVSFHTYRQDFMLATTRNLFSIVNETDGQIHIHNDLSQVPGDFLGKTRLPAFIDIAVPSGANALYQSFLWDTRAVDTSPELYYADGVDTTVGKTRAYTDHLRTFSKAVVYTDTQCSGEVNLQTPSVQAGELQASNLRRVDGYWKFNGFRDIVEDRNLRFIDRFDQLITSNLNTSMEWYNQRRITGTYAVLRLIADDSDTSLNALYLLSVEAKARKLTR